MQDRDLRFGALTAMRQMAGCADPASYISIIRVFGWLYLSQVLPK
jgi:hypothetical protein